MPRKKKEIALGCMLLVLGLPILLVNWISNKAGIPAPVTWTVIAAIVVATLYVHLRAQNRKIRALQVADIDSMTGTQFELYLEKVLRSRGYRVVITGASGDMGVDLVASRAQDRIAIQVKRHTGTVSRRAISDAVAGMHHYQCNRAMVITNSHFTPDAITLARSTRCALIDRSALVNWIIQFQTAAHTRNQPRKISFYTFRKALYRIWISGRPGLAIGGATLFLLTLIYFSQQKPVADRYHSPDAKVEPTANAMAFSPTVNFGDTFSPNVADPQLTPVPTTQNYATPIVSPSSTETQSSHSTEAIWPDGKTLNHPDHFVETHIVNVAKGESLKLRGGPGTRFRVLAQIPVNATNVLAFDEDQVWNGDSWWCPVEWNGLKGYISRAYLPQ
jgi:restriction system protein